jgi:hypothetical protein
VGQTTIRLRVTLQEAKLQVALLVKLLVVGKATSRQSSILVAGQATSKAAGIATEGEVAGSATKV